MTETDLEAIRRGDVSNLKGADLSGEDLRWADLRGANLEDADLRDADLEDADLTEADLEGADLEGADLRDADLEYAYLVSADLTEADLKGADLREADLSGADLREADLRYAVLRDTDLREADLNWAALPAYERLPESGSFEAYKGCKGNVVRLTVPADAERTSSLIGPKCRVEYAVVDEVLDARGEPCSDTATTSWYDEGFVYEEGEVVEPDDWDPDPRVECTSGIHVYPTESEAIDAVR